MIDKQNAKLFYDWVENGGVADCAYSPITAARRAWDAAVIEERKRTEKLLTALRWIRDAGQEATEVIAEKAIEEWENRHGQ